MRRDIKTRAVALTALAAAAGLILSACSFGPSEEDATTEAQDVFDTLLEAIPTEGEKERMIIDDGTPAVILCSSESDKVFETRTATVSYLIEAGDSAAADASEQAIGALEDLGVWELEDEGLGATYLREDFVTASFSVTESGRMVVLQVASACFTPTS